MKSLLYSIRLSNLIKYSKRFHLYIIWIHIILRHEIYYISSILQKFQMIVIIYPIKLHGTLSDNIIPNYTGQINHLVKF